jgi:GAF domain-containing protein
MDTRNEDGAAHNVAAELQSLLLGADGIEAFLGEVARRAAGVIDQAQSCGVTVRSTPQSRMLGATSSELARRMDEIQYDVDDGPCLRCLRHGRPVVVADIGSDTRWPAFSERGTREGAGASLSVPLTVGERSVGALNLYSRRAHGLDETDHARARQFADQAAGAIALALLLRDRAERERHLENALTSRSTIDQAIGVIMARGRINAKEAFDILRQRSQHTNVKLRDVAMAVLDEVTAHQSQ